MRFQTLIRILVIVREWLTLAASDTISEADEKFSRQMVFKILRILRINFCCKSKMSPLQKLRNLFVEYFNQALRCLTKEVRNLKLFLKP